MSALDTCTHTHIYAYPVHSVIFEVWSVSDLILPTSAGYNFTSSSLDGQTNHYIVEAFKLSYAYRILLGDPEFNVTVEEVGSDVGVMCVQCVCMLDYV